jgi:hypothetical protein
LKKKTLSNASYVSTFEIPKAGKKHNNEGRSSLTFAT